MGRSPKRTCYTNHMNEATINFIEELKNRDDVLGVILFGSWARGNNRPTSDVDLLVILTEGYRRTVEYRDGQAFEIIYTTASSAFAFWEENKDDCANLWSVAKIVFDRDGSTQNLKEKACQMISLGKKPIDEYQLGQFQFSAEDEIRAVETMIESDSVTGSLVLSKTVMFLTELFFDIRQEWTPAPKQRIIKMREINPELYSALEKFYQDGNTLRDKIEVAKEITQLVFQK